jgi:hypothetical protein
MESTAIKKVDAAARYPPQHLDWSTAYASNMRVD